MPSMPSPDRVPGRERLLRRCSFSQVTNEI